MRIILWALALISLGVAATPATSKPVAKSKTAAKAAAKTVATKAPPKTIANKTASHPVATGRPTARPATASARTVQPARASATVAAKGRVQPTYSRYASSRYATTARNGRRPSTATTGRTVVRPVYHPVPAQPSQERYREIQSALAQKGYLHTEPSGTWDADSIDAMKRFQKEQSLDADGKLSSLSLIALGLGPKRTLSASAAGSVSAPPKP